MSKSDKVFFVCFFVFLVILLLPFPARLLGLQPPARLAMLGPLAALVAFILTAVQKD
ncbi:MAG: hypothetical protein HYV63_19175 [Candidatus Schekmanbacteria bacterium]|nr:hypothetical protein [Candidatus Schekmanbacteria bacterium]